jgi:hypothetical protein
MYPQAELTRLAAHKGLLQRASARHRSECANVAARIAQPLEWIDGMSAAWRRLAPLALFAVVPLALLVARAARPRLKFLGLLLRWAPVVLGATRGLGAIFQRRAGFAPR